MKLIFATNNENKVKEINAVLPDEIEVISLQQAGINIDIPEPYDTLSENASEKSRVISALTNTDCFSEDTGLEIEVLNGAPGVKSARYAGEERNFQANIDLVMQQMQHELNRRARFRTVISLRWEGKEYLFEGVCNGHITNQQKGHEGFGYDPIFIPEGSTNTFAEMSLIEKK